MHYARRIAWGWVAAGALGAAFSALALLSEVFIGSHVSVFALAHYALLPSLGTVVLGAGALGALLALPAAMPARVAHPALAVGLIAALGPVDWFPWLHGGAKGIAQGATTIAMLAAAIRYRRADARPGLVAGAALVAMTLSPIAIWGAKSIEAERNARWHFAAGERFARALERRAQEAAHRARALPDLYVIIVERHPSPRNAARRGWGYDEAALDDLRSRGWQISNDAHTNAPHTETTFASMLSLSETLSDGMRTRRADAAQLNALASAREIALSRAFAAPLALDVLARAGYRSEAWVGWWLPTMALRTHAIDHAQARSGTAHLWTTLRAAWTQEHRWKRSEGTSNDESLHERVGTTQAASCERFVAQRERLFARRDREGDAPRFALYHVFWIHAALALDSDGACAAHDAPRDALLDTETPTCAEQWSAHCITLEERARRTRGVLAYLPHFLERIEGYARTHARGRAFRIPEPVNDIETAGVSNY